MLTSIQISRLKAFSESAVVPILPLTVLAGTNSVGKSTLLQALLVLKQSVESTSNYAGLDLNGVYAALGSFRDTYSRGGSANGLLEIAICCQLEGSKQELKYSFRSDGSRAKLCRVEAFLEKVLVSEYKEPAGEEQERLASFLGSEQALVCTANSKQFLVFSGIKPVKEISFETSMDNISRQGYIKEECKFLVENLIKLLVEQIAVSGPLARQQISHLETALRSFQWQTLAEALNPLIASQADIEELRRTALPEEKWHFLEKNLDDQQLDVIYLLFAFQEIELDVISACERLYEIGNLLPATGYRPIQSEAYSVISQVADYVSERIHYLGPLRRPPLLSYADKRQEPLFKIQPDGNGLMAHLKRRWKERTSFPSPFEGSEEPTVDSCINAWCKFLRIGNGLELEERDDGYEVRVLPLSDDSAQLDITASDLPTNVGVGVTQLLPVIALLVLTQPGATCIFEQPELHLHPSAQTGLGELFAAAVVSGRQLLVETHSEHFINGIQLAVAEKKLNPPDIALLYVGRESGGRKIKLVELDSRGLIGEWPEGFFDEAERGAAKLLRAAFRQS